MHLIDTDTMVSLLRRQPLAMENLRKNEANPRAISVITYGELLLGARKSNKPVENETKVLQLVQLGRIVPASAEVMEIYASVRLRVEKIGRPVPDLDLIIASTAILLRYTLVTNNLRHFADIPDLTVENWMR